jgi:chromate transporter
MSDLNNDKKNLKAANKADNKAANKAVDLKTLGQLFISFLKIGAFTIGGGLAMLPLIQKEFVDRRKWIDDEEMIDIIAIGQSIPGAIAVNTSLFVGEKIAGTKGAVVSVLGTVLPSFVAITLIVIVISDIRDNVYVSKFFSGIKAASAALILVSAVKVGKSVLKGKGKIGYIIAAISFVAIVFFDINSAWAILFGAICGLTGYLIDRINERRKAG